MSFLQSLFFGRKKTAFSQMTVFGQYVCTDDGQVKFTPNSDLNPRPVEIDLANENSNHTINEMLIKLIQAEENDDFGEGEPKTHSHTARHLNAFEEVHALTQQGAQICNQLRQLKGAPPATIDNWLKEEKTSYLVSNFLKNLDKTYKLRTTPAKIKSVCWELADAIVMALVGLGLAVAILHLAGVGLFGSAFAHLVAPSTTATLIKASTAAVGAAATGWYNFFHAERQLKTAIKKDLAELKRDSQRIHSSV
jgi:hypothetical protein